MRGFRQLDLCQRAQGEWTLLTRSILRRLVQASAEAAQSVPVMLCRSAHVCWSQAKSTPLPVGSLTFYRKPIHLTCTLKICVVFICVHPYGNAYFTCMLHVLVIDYA